MRVAKVLVVGAAEAGKSTLIGALTPSAMNLAVNGRTVAMDHGTLERSGMRLSLVGVPGQRRFRVVREALSTGAQAAIWVHRSGDQIDPETTLLISDLQPVPYLVYINHSDGTDGSDDWVTPEPCPPPKALISGNLMSPGRSLDVLIATIWSIM